MKDELKAALIYAASVQTIADIEGMKAENQHRIICDNQISYGDEAFIDVRDKLISKVKKIIKKSKTDADNTHNRWEVIADFDNLLPPGYTVMKSPNGYYAFESLSGSTGEYKQSKFAAAISAWQVTPTA